MDVSEPCFARNGLETFPRMKISVPSSRSSHRPHLIRRFLEVLECGDIVLRCRRRALQVHLPEVGVRLSVARFCRYLEILRCRFEVHRDALSAGQVQLRQAELKWMKCTRIMGRFAYDCLHIPSLREVLVVGEDVVVQQRSGGRGRLLKSKLGCLPRTYGRQRCLQFRPEFECAAPMRCRSASLSKRPSRPPSGTTRGSSRSSAPPRRHSRSGSPKRIDVVSEPGQLISAERLPIK